MSDDDELVVWCRADLSPFGKGQVGGYHLTITYDDDHALSLGRDELLMYVFTMMDALTRAQYTEAVRRQLITVGVPERMVLPSVIELREEWPELPTFGGYSLRPTVSFEGSCSVQVYHGDTFVVQFAPRNVREHIEHALRVYVAADLDSSYRRYLLGVIGIEPGRATNVVEDLGNYLPGDDPPDPPPRPRPRPPRRKRRR